MARVSISHVRWILIFSAPYSFREQYKGKLRTIFDNCPNDFRRTYKKGLKGMFGQQSPLSRSSLHCYQATKAVFYDSHSGCTWMRRAKESTAHAPVPYLHLHHRMAQQWKKTRSERGGMSDVLLSCLSVNATGMFLATQIPVGRIASR